MLFLATRPKIHLSRHCGHKSTKTLVKLEGNHPTRYPPNFRISKIGNEANRCMRILCLVWKDFVQPVPTAEQRVHYYYREMTGSAVVYFGVYQTSFFPVYPFAT